MRGMMLFVAGVLVSAGMQAVLAQRADGAADRRGADTRQPFASGSVSAMSQSR